MAEIYGTIGIRAMGTYNANTKYELLNLVEYDGSSYVAHTDPPLGTLPTNTDYWQISASGTSKATASTPGTVMPDGVTTEVDSNGALSVKTATQSTAGIVKGSAGIKVAADGSIDVNTLFEQAAELANIIAGEAITTALGKIAKSIAVTMGLNENALLKNMLTNMDADDSTKIPTSKFVHKLYERIGMGEDLDIGDNLTAVVKSLNSNLTNMGTFQFAQGTNKAIPAHTNDWLCDWLGIAPGTYLVGFTSQPTDNVNTYLKVTTDNPDASTYGYTLLLKNSGSASRIIKIDSYSIVSTVIENTSEATYNIYADPAAYCAWAIKIK